VSAAPALVSVLVPSFNKRAYVAETLDSVLGQTLREHELIVVDDGSTDGSRDVLRTYEARATILYEPNRGASAARARALREAHGRYVMYLDADDVLLPHALAEHVAALERSAADVAYSDYRHLRADAAGTFAPAEIVRGTLDALDADPELACFLGFWRPPAALLYTRALTERLSWSATLPVIQDARYLLDAAAQGARFVHVPTVCALYRDLPGAGLSRSSAARFASDLLTNADEVSALWHARGPLDDRHRAALADVYEHTARELFRHEPAAFDRCMQRLAALGVRRPLGWPWIALRLRRVAGQALATRMLTWLGRPPP
jgi:glycosyltransferase involved in cell wall biosynthesis